MAAGVTSQMISDRVEPTQGALHGLPEEAVTLLDSTANCGLVSITRTLPSGQLPETTALSPQLYWRSPDDPAELLSCGEAFVAPMSSDVAGTLAEWRTFGDGDSPPCAFFTSSPPPRPAAARIWWPAVLVRRTPGADEVTFTARSDSSPRSIARQWREEWNRLLTPSAGEGPGRAMGDRQVTPSARDWLAAVSATLVEIAEGRLEKAVLARRLVVELARPLDPAQLAQRLVRHHPDCHVLVIPHEGGQVVAASPERLAIKRGDTLVCDALAGTTRRGAQPQDEQRETAALLACPKQRHEHAVVVDGIVAALKGVCTSVSAAQEPKVRRLRSLLHLWTEVKARLQPGQGLLDVVSRLHPTAAVLGSPSADARRWLDKLGEQRDGLYTGVAGRIDQCGDGEAIVILRSAFLKRQSAVLWAGAGIVAGSRPINELREIDLKLDTMREALGCS